MHEFFLAGIGQIHFDPIKVGNVRLDRVLLLCCLQLISGRILVIQYGELFQKFCLEVCKAGRSGSQPFKMVQLLAGYTPHQDLCYSVHLGIVHVILL